MENYPEKTKLDKTADIIHVAAQLIPLGAGSAISEFIKSFFPQGFERRREEWLKGLAEKIENMSQKQKEQVNSFFEEEEGKTLLLKATLAAISTHKRDKLLAIRNVLLSTVFDSSLYYDQKEICIGIITDLEPYDLVLLKIINTHRSEFGEADSYGKAFEISKDNGFEGNQDEFFLILNKLRNKSLVRISEHISGFDDVYTVDVIIGEDDDRPKFIVTALAEKLVKFVEETI